MEKNVKIKLTSSIMPTDGELQTYELWLSGQYIKKDNNYYLRYEELMDEQPIQTTVKINEQKALILRNGSIKMRLPFNVRRRERGHFENLYGMLSVETKTHNLQFTEQNEEDLVNGIFSVQYELIIQGKSVGDYSLEINYSEGSS